MALLDDPSGKDRGTNYAQYGMLAAVPAVLALGPLIGYFAGHWADEKLGTEPYLMVLGVVLGFRAAGIEIYELIKKAQRLEKRNNNR